MSKKNTLLKSTNLTIFCALLLLFLVPFFIFIGKRHIAEIFADFAYGFLVLSLILGISEQIKIKSTILRRTKIFNVLLILFILIIIFTLSTRSLNKGYRLKVNEKKAADVSIYLEMGKSFLDNKDYDRAIEEFKNAIKIDNGNFKSYYLIGRAFYKKGDYESARDYLFQAIRINKYDFLSNILLAVVFENIGDYDKAIVQYKIAKDLNPYDFGVHYGLGRTFYRVGKVYKALNELLIAKEKNPTNFEVNFILGKIYYEKGDFKNSLKYFKFCETINSEDKKVQDYINYLKKYD
ncbi:MAG: tetratricopeptide repeat protein [Actinobacteria bacterium]|nr:tetratricopeptide repeat protein [Actinomycetota bacterium]